VQPGDLVIGTLPAQIAARICERGGRYQHLTLDLPENLRGQNSP
jgi:CRISPR-associated protein Csx16